MAMMKTVIQAEKIYFKYSKSYCVLDDVSLSIRSGQIYFLLGANGIGKSTLLKCLCGILKPQQGTIFLDDTDISTLKPGTIAKKIGYVPQSQVSQFPFSIREIVVMGRAPHLGLFESPTQDDYQIADNALVTVGISHIAGKPCDSISGGEWQLCLIARALAQQPEILVLDEPTSHLDLGNQMKILEVIQKVSQNGTTVVMASHFPDHALLIAHHVAIINNNTIAYEGHPDDVITESIIKEVYSVNVKICSITNGVERKICVPIHNHSNTDITWINK